MGGIAGPNKFSTKHAPGKKKSGASGDAHLLSDRIGKCESASRHVNVKPTSSTVTTSSIQDGAFGQ